MILAEQGDNTGGGAPGDGTDVLRLFQARIAELAPALVLYVVDPATAAEAHSAGLGATITAAVGGKSHAMLGPPVEFPGAVVKGLTDGNFVYDGPMFGGKPDCVS